MGRDNFRIVREGSYTFVDKSLFIKAILQDPSQVILITRPRRFGKSLNMSMLQYFFAAQVNNQPTRELFNALKIMDEPECMQHQGQYPVIYINFKDVKGETYEQFLYQMSIALSTAYRQHKVLLDHPELSDADKQRFHAVIERQADPNVLQSALQDLMRYLMDSYGKRIMVLIDEYDTPLQSAYFNQYYDKVIGLIRGLLGAGLKGNDFLEKAVLTGILRVAKEGMFSGLNNVVAYSVLNPEYSEYFGFMEAEVQSLLYQAGLSKREEEVRQWYNGYYMGHIRIYNPWSIINYLHYKGQCDAYWLNSSDNQWLQELLIRSSIHIKIGLEQLLQGRVIDVQIPDQFVFDDVAEDEATLWSLLVMGGYLTAKRSKKLASNATINSNRVAEIDAATQLCTLEIPNYEVRATYTQLVRRWLSKDRLSVWYDTFMEYLLNRDIEAWSKQLQEVMLQIVSYHDPVKYPEAFYHGLLLGIVVYLHQRGYVIKSNRESGQGRYDIAVIPQDATKLGILLELKQIPLSNHLSLSKIEKKLAISASEAFAQIELNCYDTELRQAGISRICKIAIAFCGKKFQLQYAIKAYP